MQKYNYYVMGTGCVDPPSFTSLEAAYNYCYDFLNRLVSIPNFYAKGGVKIAKVISESTLHDFTEDDTPSTYKAGIMVDV